MKPPNRYEAGDSLASIASSPVDGVNDATTPICTSTPNETDTTAWASIILKDETEIPAATQYWPACGENVFCSAGMTFAIVSAGLASALGALRGSSGYCPTS